MKSLSSIHLTVEPVLLVGNQSERNLRNRYRASRKEEVQESAIRLEAFLHHIHIHIVLNFKDWDSMMQISLIVI